MSFFRKLFCRLGLHRWGSMNYGGPMPKLWKRCRWCGEGVVFNPMLFTEYHLSKTEMNDFVSATERLQ